MQIKTIHRLKMSYQHNIKGINWILNFITGSIENIIVRKSKPSTCVISCKNEELINRKLLKNTDIPIVISMTTYPKRESKVVWTIKSLLGQSTAADRFVVWLDRAEYDKIPASLKKFEEYGVEFRFCTSLRSHKKYFYAMQEFKDSAVITVDDDVIYPEDTVEKLVEAYKKHPDCVICNLARYIALNDEGFARYKDATYKLSKNIIQPSFRLLPIGEGAVLYPPHSLSDEVFNEEAIVKYAFSADDLWLKFMAVKNNTKTVVTRIAQKGLCQVRSEKNDDSPLNSLNCGGGQNDIVIKNLNKAYPEVLDIIRND